jgi:hypothetical protein
MDFPKDVFPSFPTGVTSNMTASSYFFSDEWPPSDLPYGVFWWSTLVVGSIVIAFA